ncbi:MAG: hypothetical protein HY905_23480 [Deltaproteobacteria bacterium]|nr:hypothetical protein [Deltaproteobacteria bacterium]
MTTRPRGSRSGNASAQVAILREIWNEMKALKASLETELELTRRELASRIDQTNKRLDAVPAELKDEIGGLRGRLLESEVRLATATTALAGDVRDLGSLIRDWRDEHRADRSEFRSRVARIEQHVGLAPKT